MLRKIYLPGILNLHHFNHSGLVLWSPLIFISILKRMTHKNVMRKVRLFIYKIRRVGRRIQEALTSFPWWRLRYFPKFEPSVMSSPASYSILNISCEVLVHLGEMTAKGWYCHGLYKCIFQVNLKNTTQ